MDLDTRTAVVVLIAFAFGSFETVRMVVSTNLVFDFAPRHVVSRAVGVSNLIAALGLLAGAIVGGGLFNTIGVTGTSIAAGGAYIASGLPLVRLPRRLAHDGTPGAIAPIRQAIELIRNEPALRALVTVAILTEVFGFGVVALDPLFAGDVFAAGAFGLGLIVAARSLGRFIGSVALGLVRIRRLGMTLGVATVSFGLAVIGFAAAPTIWLALPLGVVAGIAGVLVDSIEQTALQVAVPDRHRGRAAGLWVFALGTGPVGIVLTSLLAELVGPRSAQMISGGALLGFGLLIVTRVFGRALQSLAD